MATKNIPDLDKLVNNGEFWNCISLLLTQGRHTLIDCEDYDRLIVHGWRYNNNGYAIKAKTPHPKAIHHFILDVPQGREPDHRNHNRLDNRKKNLRICTEQQQAWNRRLRKDNLTGYKGVNYHKRDELYQAIIWVDGRCRYLGYFKTAIEAARAYNAAASKHFGEFACLNEIDNATNRKVSA